VPATAAPSEVPLEEGARAVAEKLLELPDPLCSECRGRIVGRLGHGFSNPERTLSLARQLGRAPPAAPPTPEECSLCGGAFANLPRWVERCRRAGEEWEWGSFRCGSRWDPERLVREEALWLQVGSSWGESVRAAFNRELGKAISAVTGKPGDQEPPDLVFLAEVPAGLISLTVSPIFFSGRYRKLDRTLPQTRWPCRACHGKGCTRCDGTGKMYATSVEEIVGGPVLELARGSAHAFHGMGREDIDARMLGRGRPFILEISRPHRRAFPIPEALAAISALAAGRVEVDALAPCSGKEVERVKSARPEKSYRVVVAPSFPEAKVNEVLSVVAGRPLEQRTPSRVVHRRADIPRLRTVREARFVAADAQSFTVEVRADAGTYIKEFVEGDGGRTRPSLAELLGSPLKVLALDVLEIHDDEVPRGVA
jgi:tRNA pseudouridine synthase 10